MKNIKLEPPRPRVECSWKWVCELCYRTTDEPTLPNAWQFVFMSAVCPSCIKRAKADHVSLPHARGGMYAGNRQDPRAQATQTCGCTKEILVLNQLRQWLKEGMTIRATDPSGKVLEKLEDGSWYGGLTVTPKP